MLVDTMQARACYCYQPHKKYLSYNLISLEAVASVTTSVPGLPSVQSDSPLMEIVTGTVLVQHSAIWRECAGTGADHGGLVLVASNAPITCGETSGVSMEIGSVTP